MGSSVTYLERKNESQRKLFKSVTGYGGPSRVFYLDKNFDVIKGKSLDLMHAMILNAYKTTIRLCLEKLNETQIKEITQRTKLIQRQSDLKSEINYKLTGNITILDAFKGSPKGIKKSSLFTYTSSIK